VSKISTNAPMEGRQSENAVNHPTVYCIVRDGVVSFVSSTSKDVGGFAPEHFQGQLALDLIHPDDRAQFEHLTSPTWEGVVSATFRVQDADGGWSWRRAEGVRTADADGLPSTVVAIDRVDGP
jgi:PAS domain S-box-containing protein